MSTVAFRAGTVFDIDGKRYTLLRLVEDHIWQAEESRTKRIQELTEEKLRQLYVQGQLRFTTHHDAAPGAHSNAVPTYSPEQWEQAKVRRAYVMATLSLPNTRHALLPAITEVWEKLREPAAPPNPATVIRWKNKFINAGQDITAIIDHTHKKGNRHARFPKEVEEFVAQAIDVKYMTLERGTIQDTFEHALTLVLRENKLRPAATQLPLPTRRMVTRMIEAIPAFDRYAARHGQMAATKRFRSVQRHRTTAAPLERAEIDHSPLDLMVIDDETGLPLGRPYITACIDDYTRCILGLHVSFEPPSHLTVARCLKQAFLPKVALANEFPAIKNEWQAHGVMRELVVDNGTEFHSASLENACYSLGIEIHYSARKTPWFKGKVERFLGTLNRAVAHGTPGTTFSNIFDKEEYDPSKHAIVRYSVLKEIVNTWIVDVYHQQVHRTLGAPPAAVWSKSISPDEVLVPEDPARLDAILGKSEVRRLTHKGIELYGLLYNSHELTGLRRKIGEKLDVEIRVDSSDLGEIIVLSPDKRQLFTVPAINREYASGLSEWQHRVCKRFAARHLEQYSPEGWLEAKARIADLIDNELMHKKQKTRTRIARYKEHQKAPQLPTPPAELAIKHAPLPPPEARPECPPVVTPVPAHASDAAPQVEATPVTPRKFKPIFRERLTPIADMNEER
ncbi:Mu transposase C-terminal domain-containing protein [Thauera sp. 63]|uniref:Mu transposase C-terminal domain-containing protein n=1 Tax=Thauera sp. 63 TaxID=497321 RepID=UPI0002D1019C|nr:DDE-type integrase/transposase/recombinase [Thauera sp. 63]ENO77619.1 integrase catalytic subunit [Thauera sp. 63]